MDQQKTKQNQSVKINQKGAAEQKKVENLTVGQAMGQCEVPLCWLLFFPLCNSLVLTTQTAPMSLEMCPSDRVMKKTETSRSLTFPVVQ